ncbi:ATP-binding cassette family ATPase ARB1 [Ascoidea rubescens DSM 1968]|uniref:ATPase of the ATP-binding cassette family n=1 Tax=Ascoidea rubescens DSM 1968 TaxID=1344418 RepID=A0A1D2V8F5_9ASCO|nr:ATPase of the ATP-binding cassette family [Ascoidea rubescens DSM 1968]ODV57956.1 ATPase of the ATP-binding cassette family [Ascoidea rubescens DSM 1968]
MDRKISSSKAKREAKRLASGKKPKKERTSKKSATIAEKSEAEIINDLSNLDLQKDKHGLSDRVTTGVLDSLETSRDIKLSSISLLFHGKVLISDSNLELNFGRRYGLLGANGCGKSTFLKSIAAREFPIPEFIDIYLLNQPAIASDFSALDYVINEAKLELKRLEDLLEHTLINDGPESPILDDLYERIDDLDPSTFQSRASVILIGLGFNSKTILKKTKDMSGGWKMRVALAKALFVQPTLLLLDDPTAHLDLEACVWLEEYLKKFNKILILVSHSQDFLNGVCTNIIDMKLNKLSTFTGNYDTFVKTKNELDTNQMKQYYKQQDEINHIKKFIASAGTYSNLVRQAKSRQKILDKMEADGLIQPVTQDKIFSFKFPEIEKLPPPVLSFDNISFSYSGNAEDNLFKNLSFGVDMDSRIALVGPNGVGKSTLLKLMTGKLQPQSGRISKHTHLKIGVYSQHSADQLDLSKNPLEFVRDKFSNISQDFQYWRQQLGRFGLTGEGQTSIMATLSEGQRSRVVFALLALESPNILLLDEPTNGLDIPTIDSLAEAINSYNGGVCVVSHDFRLLNKIAKDIFVIEHKTATKWEGSILDYKKKLAKNIVL